MSHSTESKRQQFRDLHASGCFVIPNPWDAGSARYLEGLGFKALATTSSGYAWSNAQRDGGTSLQEMLTHIAHLAAIADVPVNADYGNGYAKDAAEVERNARRVIETGVAGFSIEDATDDEAQPLYDVETAVERIRAARRAIDSSGAQVLLTGRAENYLWGRPDLEDTVARLRRYSEAGADCLYAPGIKRREDIVAVVRAVAPKPVNLLVGSASEFDVADIAAMGVRRISVGGGLARSAWGGFMRSAQMLAQQGKFDALADGASGNELNALFHADAKTRSADRHDSGSLPHTPTAAPPRG